jgi:type I restriction enzyme S subunit
MPSTKLIEDFSNIGISIRKQLINNIEQNQKLSELRDWLLPMLMNGQVTVGKPYQQEEEKLGMAAEPGAAYMNDKESIDALFETIDFDYEVAAIQLLTEQRFGFTYGKKYTHKMFSNMQLLNTMPKLNNLVFEEKGWGMFSKAIAKTIDEQKFIYFHKLDHGAEVLKVRSNNYKDVVAWMATEENKGFVAEVENMLTIYERSLINKDMDRIELFNTVLECISVLETDNLLAIRHKMDQWPMTEGGFRNKAEKFTEKETKQMIQFVEVYFR